MRVERLRGGTGVRVGLRGPCPECFRENSWKLGVVRRGRVGFRTGFWAAGSFESSWTAGSGGVGLFRGGRCGPAQPGEVPIANLPFEVEREVTATLGSETPLSLLGGGRVELGRPGPRRGFGITEEIGTDLELYARRRQIKIERGQ